MSNSISECTLRSNDPAYRWLPGQFARSNQWYARDEKNLPKQLAELFVDRHEHEFRFVRRLDSWLHFNGDRWCLDCGLHLAAAGRLCDEAARTLWNPHVDTPAMASALLRLASFNPKMTAAIEGKTEPMLEGFLGKREVSHV